MANVKISDLTAFAAALASGDLFEIEDVSASASNKLTLAQLFAGFEAIGQLKFPATQSASSDANTLDDYEEGTWTPTVSAGSGTFTSASATGKYTVVGNVCHYHADVTITTNGTAASTVNFTLPFNSTGVNHCGGRQSATGKFVHGQVSGGSNSMGLQYYDATYPGADGVSIRVSGFIYLA